MRLNGHCKLGKCNWVYYFILMFNCEVLSAQENYKEVSSDMGALELVVSELCYEAIHRHGGDASSLGKTRIKIDKLETGVSIKCLSEDKDKVKRLHDWADVFLQAKNR